MLKQRLRRGAVAYTIVLMALNIYFYNYASLFAMLYPDSDIRFNLYGDPQIEGDAKLRREPTTGRYDLLVNDYYLHHIYKSTIKALNPNYVVTMGDIFSSQWVSKKEYYKRIDRFSWISCQADNKYLGPNQEPVFYALPGNHDIGYGAETKPRHINRFTKNFGPVNHEWIIDRPKKRRQHNHKLKDHPNKSKESHMLHRVAMVNAMNLDKTRNTEFRNRTWAFIKALADEQEKTPDIPLLLFLHIPLYKPNGMCADSSSFVYKDGFVKYQSFLTPVTSAYILHCLSPTMIFNGHDHKGCSTVHSKIPMPNQPMHLGNGSLVITPDKDFCSLSLDQLDLYEKDLERLFFDTVTTVKNTDAVGSWDTVEITVRSMMGAYDGVTGVFDIRNKRYPVHANKVVSAWGRSMIVYTDKHKYQYQYSELAFGHHLVIRILLIADIVSLIVVPLLIFL